jgi:signal transduction histidine kinase
MPSDDQKLDISTFLLSSVHDMKTSLAMMASYLEEALAEPGAEDSTARKKTAQALYEAQRVNDHLIQLLALYKIDQTFYPFDPQDQAIADLLREAVARTQPLANIKKFQLTWECSEDLYAWLDYDLIFGVIVQAIHNALHYGQSRVLLIATQHETGLILRIEDDGAGYPDFLLAQSDGSHRGISFETGSTGLGLYFAGVVARLHKSNNSVGRTTLENGGRLGGGCFILQLP